MFGFSLNIETIIDNRFQYFFSSFVRNLNNLAVGKFADERFIPSDYVGN